MQQRSSDAAPTGAAAKPAMGEEVIEVTTDRVACDGGGGPLGHPMVFLTLGEAGQVVCGYCGRRFVRRRG